MTPALPDTLVLRRQDLAWFVDQAVDGIVGILQQAGDDLANRRPGFPGANTLHALGAHCAGVMTHWAGRLVAGREVDRDRDAEFAAHGPVADLIEHLEATRAQFHLDLGGADGLAPLHPGLAPDDARLPLGASQSGALLHVFEELQLHLGHMQVTLDLLAGTSPSS